MKPIVSVVMSTFKEPIEFIRTSVESILAQTYPYFEFLVAIDDPSRIELIDFFKKYEKEDNRLKVYVNPTNLGQANSRNQLIKRSKGRYIAIMDADDESILSRLEEQIQYMEENKNVHILGAKAYKMDERGIIYGEMNIPIHEKCIELYLKNGFMPLIHPTMITRREVYEDLKGYRNVIVEDFDFLLRAHSKGFTIHNIEKPLLKYRIYNSMFRLSSSKGYYQYLTGKYILKEYKKNRILSIDIDEFNKKIFQKTLFSSVSMRLYSFARNHFERANDFKSKKQWIKFFWHFLLSLSCPQNMYNIVKLIKVKLQCKLLR